MKHPSRFHLFCTGARGVFGTHSERLRDLRVPTPSPARAFELDVREALERTGLGRWVSAEDADASPVTFERVEAFVPGSAERLMRAAEQCAEERRTAEDDEQRRRLRWVTAGQMGTFGALLLSLALALLLVQAGFVSLGLLLWGLPWAALLWLYVVDRVRSAGGGRTTGDPYLPGDEMRVRR